MHGNPIVGYEVMPSNVKYTATGLRLVSEEFDYTQAQNTISVAQPRAGFCLRAPPFLIPCAFGILRSLTFCSLDHPAPDGRSPHPRQRPGKSGPRSTWRNGIRSSSSRCVKATPISATPKAAPTAGGVTTLNRCTPVLPRAALDGARLSSWPCTCVTDLSGIDHHDFFWVRFGIFSNHPLTDLAVYDDDVIVHTSNQDCFPYYRTMSSLEDSPAMEGNCKDAIPGYHRPSALPLSLRIRTFLLTVFHGIIKRFERACLFAPCLGILTGPQGRCTWRILF